jgi:single-strand DNA-binding protein
MATDTNVVVLIGRLTADPALSYTQGGTAVCKFSLAVNRSSGSGDQKKEHVSFFNCVAWQKGGEIIAQYAKKGDRLSVTGRLEQRSWDDKDGNKRSAVEIVVNGFQFLTQKDGAKTAAAQVEDAFGAPEDPPF